MLRAGRAKDAETALRKAVELDPGGPIRHMLIGESLLLQGKPDAALREMQEEKDEGWRLVGLALAHSALGQRDEGDAALQALKDKYAGDSAYQIAQAYAFRGEPDMAFAWLDRAYDQRDAGLSEIKADPLMRGIMRDPRYAALLRKLKLPA